MARVGDAATLAVSSAQMPLVPQRPYRFFVRMAWACAAVAFLGFAPTYWAPLARGTFDGAPILHLHGLVFFAWTALFIAQAYAADRREHARHRALGLLGISLATAMLFAGMLVTIHGLKQGIAAGVDERARAFAIVPVTTIALFVGLFTAAIANARRPTVHFRLMLAATITLLTPAFARIVRYLLAPSGAIIGSANPPPVTRSLIASALTDLVLAVAIVHDWRERGRPHRAYVIAAAVSVTVQALRVPLAGTAAWHAITNWLLILGG